MSDEKTPLVTDPEAPASDRQNEKKSSYTPGKGYWPEFSSGYFLWLARGCFAEFLGLMIFVVFGVGTVMTTLETDTDSRLIAISLAHGMTIVICIYLFNHISGGHINPAVTFALMLAGECDPISGACFMVSQCLGSITGALFLKFAVPTAYHGGFGTQALAAGVTAVQGLCIETFLTFLLVLTVFLTAVDSKNGATAGTGMAPFAIGMSVMVEHFVGVRLTGASMNPGRSFGPAVISNIWSTHYIWWLGPFCGAFLAFVVFKVLTIKVKQD